MTLNCNVLLLGKSGAGKSSLANYVFDSGFKIGDGRPVTDWEHNFQHQSIMLKSGIVLNVLDSVGLEMDNTEKWFDEINGLLKRGIKDDALCDSDAANRAIHTLIYVINAASGRAEDLKALEKIRGSEMLSKVVALTNCDTAKEEQIVAIENEAKEFGFTPIRVVSVSFTKRNGEQSQKRGKQEIWEKVLEGSYNFVGKKLVDLMLERSILILENIREIFAKCIEESSISLLRPSSIEEDFKKLEEQIEGTLNWDSIDIFFEKEVLTPEIRSYMMFLEEFADTDIVQVKEFMEVHDVVEKAFSDFEPKFPKEFEKIEKQINSDSTWENIKGAANMASKVMFIKGTLKEGVDSIINEIILKLQSERDKLNCRAQERLHSSLVSALPTNPFSMLWSLITK